MGKTAFALSMAKNIAADHRIPIAFFSLEMSNVQLVNRLISNACEISGWMIARGEVSWIWQLVVSNSRTSILVGIIIALDALLLTLLMMGDKTWILDFKWIIILLIVDFLLLFQLMPLIYMMIKAFFPEGSFSLETFKRLYTYSLNLDALTNTLIAASATMVLEETKKKGRPCT